MKPSNAGALKALARLKNDLPAFAASCLKIKTKTGAIAALRFNRAQAHVHERIEDQRRRTGKVRVLLLKARQQGFPPISRRAFITVRR